VIKKRYGITTDTVDKIRNLQIRSYYPTEKENPFALLKEYYDKTGEKYVTEAGLNKLGRDS
jgi:hypothetical protein